MSKSKAPKSEFKLIRGIELFATFFGLGRVSKMPGTLASLGALIFIFVLKHFSFYIYVLVFLVLFLLSFVSIEILERRSLKHDSQEIVIDEVLGMMMACFSLPNSLFYLSLAFILFRFFDILKPFPISWLDQKVKGALGVLLDDILAGFFVHIIFMLVDTEKRESLFLFF